MKLCRFHKGLTQEGTWLFTDEDDFEKVLDDLDRHSPRLDFDAEVKAISWMRIVCGP